MYGRIKKVHFVGIGGIGMSGIAEVLLNLDYKVSGSDLKSTQTTKRLEALGADIKIGHHADNVSGADVVVLSSAVKDDNPEALAGRASGIPVIPRAEMLAELMRLKYGIAVAGSHGKTTTTTLTATVLNAGGFDPTIVVGGKVKNYGSNARMGSGEFMVVEADESDGSFLMLSPAIAVVTNIDREHFDHYGSMESLKADFVTFVNKIPFYGLAILGIDSEHVRSILPEINKRHITYGFSLDAELRAYDVKSLGYETKFDVALNDKALGPVTIKIPGRHNAQNALAAIAVGLELGMDFDDIRKGLIEFESIERRMQIKAESCGIKVIDDYGHHPEEIRVTLEAIRESFNPKRLVAVFQPHRYTRTQLLFEDFAEVLSNTDILYIIDVYPAGESPIEGVSSEHLYEAVESRGHRNVHYEKDFSKVASRVGKSLKPGDVVVTLGAGNVWEIADQIGEGLS